MESDNIGQHRPSRRTGHGAHGGEGGPSAMAETGLRGDYHGATRPFGTWGNGKIEEYSLRSARYTPLVGGATLITTLKIPTVHAENSGTNAK